MYRFSHITLFSEIEFYNFEEKKEKFIRDKIESENEDYILNVNQAKYIEHIINISCVEPINILETQIYFSEEEKTISAEKHPNDFWVMPRKGYPRTIITYHIPFEGNKKLLRLRPSQRLLVTKDVKVSENEILFEVTVFSEIADSVEKEYQSFLKYLQAQLTYLQKDIESYNRKLPKKIEAYFEERKQRILKRRKLFANLSVPIRQATDTPKTFAVPVPTIRKKISSKPVVTETNFKPDPALDMDTYYQILNVINDIGVMFERLPSTYSGKGEEDLRDHILMNLEARFEGSATGETFNKKGKTDILLRYENSNVFIGECKFWKGKKSYLGTISQLLGYLTWRDSKAAVIMFVKAKDISRVLRIVKEETIEHSNYVEVINEQTESWMNYRFHINDDQNREVKIAIMLYHLPAL